MMKLMTIFKDKTQSTIWRYYAFVFLRDFTFFGAVLVPFFTDWGHISLFQVQILQSWFMLWIFILEVPTGAVADFFGRKYSLALGGLVASLGFLIYGSFPRFEIFLLGEFLLAVAVALSSGADDALLYDSLKEQGWENESKNFFGKAHTLTMLAFLIGAPIGSLIASRFELNVPTLLSAIPALVAALVAWSFKEPVVKYVKSERKRYLEIARRGFTFFYKHKTLRLLAIDGIVVASAAYFVIWLYQPLLRSIGIPISAFGFIWAGVALVEMLVAANFVRLERFVGSGKRYLTLTALGTALTFILVGFIPNWLTVGLFLVVAGGFGLTRLELMGAYMNKFIPSEQRATVLSSISMFRRLSLVVLNPIVGFLADKSLPAALLAVGVLPLLVFFFSSVKEEMLEE